jgi:hypothetical protein
VVGLAVAILVVVATYAAEKQSPDRALVLMSAVLYRGAVIRFLPGRRGRKRTFPAQVVNCLRVGEVRFRTPWDTPAGAKETNHRASVFDLVLGKA